MDIETEFILNRRVRPDPLLKSTIGLGNASCSEGQDFSGEAREKSETLVANLCQAGMNPINNGILCKG